MHLFPELPYESFPFNITAGADGHMWFTETDGNRIGRITGAGVLTEFPIPTADSAPNGITAGPDGNIWFTESSGNKIGRITPSGAITEFPLPTAAGQPKRITAGADGNLWFTEGTGNKIGRITPSGAITEFPIPTAESEPNGITAGPDGNIWFTEFSGIGRLALTGDFTPGEGGLESELIAAHTITQFPTEMPEATFQASITAGPDGNLWFTETQAGRIGRITPSGTITIFVEGIARNEIGSAPDGITAGPDGNLWFADGDANRIGRITPSGEVTEFPTPDYEPSGVAAQGDVIWFTERKGNRIGWIRARSRAQVGLDRPPGPVVGLSGG